MLPRNIPPCAPLLGFGGFGNLVLFGSVQELYNKYKYICKYVGRSLAKCSIHRERRFTMVNIYYISVDNKQIFWNEKPIINDISFTVRSLMESIDQVELT